jgi:hypothetical protein
MAGAGGRSIGERVGQGGRTPDGGAKSGSMVASSAASQTSALGTRQADLVFLISNTFDVQWFS